MRFSRRRHRPSAAPVPVRARPAPAGRAVAAGAALGVGQLVDLDEAGLLDPLEDQLRDPVAAPAARSSCTGSWLITITLISPRYPESIVPGALTNDIPARAARPDGGGRTPRSRRAGRSRSRSARPPARPGQRDVDRGDDIGSRVTVERVARAAATSGSSRRTSTSQRRRGAGVTARQGYPRWCGRRVRRQRGGCGPSDRRRSRSTYRETLRTPWWWYPVALAVAVVLAAEFHIAGYSLTDWVPFFTLLPFSVVDRLVARALAADDLRDGELSIRGAHLRCASSAASSRWMPAPCAGSSAARATRGHSCRSGPGSVPGVQLQLDDPDDPTPYWVISTRHPDRVVALLRPPDLIGQVRAECLEVGAEWI